MALRSFALAACFTLFGILAAGAQPVAPPVVREAVSELDRDYRKNGVAFLRVGWGECMERAANSRSPRMAERCLVYIYGSFLIDQSFTRRMGVPATPGMDWPDVYPSLVRMFDIMRTPVSSRQVYLDQYRGWIFERLLAERRGQ
jgi:hypothetical protein